jgi:hypothetical protein
MNRLICFLVPVLGLASLSLGQFQQQPETSTQTGPIYPPNPSYNFYSRHVNDDPFQFNWYSGQWEYWPVPYSTGQTSNLHMSPYVYNNWNSNMPDYTPVQGGPGAGSAPVQQAAPPGVQSGQPSTPPEPPPPPSTQPDIRVGTQTVRFTGKLISMRSVALMGVSEPHVLIKLLSAKGAKGTVDVGPNLDIPNLQDMSELQITATGKLGIVDGNLVLFADTLQFGNKKVVIDRTPTTQPDN